MLPPVVVNNMLPPPPVLARFSALALVASLPLLYVSLLRPPPAALAGDTAFWFLMSNCVIGALFFGSPSSKADGGHGPSSGSGCHDDDDGLGLAYSLQSYVSGAGGQTTAAAVAFDEASNNSIAVLDDDGALPFSVHASVLRQRGEEHEVAPVQPTTTDKINNAILTGQGEDDIARPSCASGDDEAVTGAAAADFATIKLAANDGALPVGPEPGLVEEEEELPEAWAVAQHSRTPDLLQHGKKRSGEGKKLRRSSTEGSERAAAEEGEYWDELTDEELNRRVEEFIARFRREMIEQEAGVVVVV